MRRALVVARLNQLSGLGAGMKRVIGNARGAENS